MIGAAIGAGAVLIKDALDGGGLDTDWKVYAGAATAGFIVGATGNAAAAAIASNAITLGSGMALMGAAGFTASVVEQDLSTGEIDYAEAAVDGLKTAFTFGTFQVLSQALSGISSTLKPSGNNYQTLSKGTYDEAYGNNSPDFVVTPNGDAIPVPNGATGPSSVVNNSGNTTGFAYQGGSTGANGQVDTVRIMDPTLPNNASPGYPNGYVVYQNASGQAVDYITGRTIPRTKWHIPLK